MNLIKQQDNWSCGLASLAMLLDCSPDELILELGHNGGKILWPELKEPNCYQGFHSQEFVDLCFGKGIGLIHIIACPQQLADPKIPPKNVWTPERCEERIAQYMDGHEGLIIGELESGARHAVAWDGGRAYDPRGYVYRFDDSEPEIVDTDLEFYPISVSELYLKVSII